MTPSLAGPKRPQDRVPLADVKESFADSLQAPLAQRGFALSDQEKSKTVPCRSNGDGHEIGHGAVVIAAITSCTNTSNPSVMLAAGLLAQKAVARGLAVKPYVKTSLAPGSRVVTDYLQKAGLTAALDQLGFNVVGLRLHDVHRKQWATARPRGRGRDSRQFGGRGRPERKSKL